MHIAYTFEWCLKERMEGKYSVPAGWLVWGASPQQSQATSCSPEASLLSLQPLRIMDDLL